MQTLTFFFVVKSCEKEPLLIIFFVRVERTFFLLKVSLHFHKVLKIIEFILLILCLGI